MLLRLLHADCEATSAWQRARPQAQARLQVYQSISLLLSTACTLDLAPCTLVNSLQLMMQRRRRTMRPCAHTHDT